MRNIALVRCNEWTFCHVGTPDTEQFVLVFRNKNKKYMIAKFIENKNKEENQEENSHDWVTQHSVCHRVDDDDLWLRFPFVIEECMYDG